MQGTLLNLKHSEEATVEEIQNAWDEVRINIKRS